MSIEKIDPLDIPPYGGTSGRRKYPETLAALELAVGEAIKFDYRWTHPSYKEAKALGILYRGCGSSPHFGVLGNKNGMKFRTRCHDGICYVERIG